MWNNYGDENFFDYGRYVKEEGNGEYRILVCDFVFDCKTERTYQFDEVFVDVNDSWIDVKAVENYADVSKETEPIQFALACVSYYGEQNFGGTKYYTESQYSTENEIREIMKNTYGIEV